MNSNLSKIIVTTCALLLVVVNQLYPLNPLSFGLLILAFSPWLAQFLKGAELPGGWKFEFKEVQEKQVQQGKDIEYLKFLIEGFLTDSEFQHLKKLSAPEPFMVRVDQTSSYFATELRRLRALGLIACPPMKGIRSLLIDDGRERNVKDHFQITDKGREYLAFRASYGGDRVPRLAKRKRR
ncbi:MAG: hypothetical protein QM796_06435 [Chthoniobacteraceae bacterium]